MILGSALVQLQAHNERLQCEGWLDQGEAHVKDQQDFLTSISNGTSRSQLL